MLFSVIIPTCERTNDLCVVLEGLAAGNQTWASDQYEVIVTDDGKSDDTKKAIAKNFPWVRYVNGPKAGPAANRNNGAGIASGDWLVFTDDDCVIDNNWLSAYAKSTGGPVQALEGRIEPIGEMNQYFSECPSNLTGGVFWSANIAIKRSLFEQVGGFDPNFLYPAHEDSDLRQRILPFTEIIFVSDAKVRHPIRVHNVREMIGLTVKRCSAWTYFQGKHRKMITNPVNFLLLVIGWMRVYYTYLKLDIKAKSVRGLFVAFLAMFVLGPYAIFKTMYFSPQYKLLGNQNARLSTGESCRK